MALTMTHTSVRYNLVVFLLLRMIMFLANHCSLHAAIYREGDSVSIIGSDGEEYGWCNVLTDGQEVQCSYGSGNIGLYHHFECKNPLSSTHSPRLSFLRSPSGRDRLIRNRSS